jgi:RNA polymerase sigma-70 factor (ECF subfamily)
MSIKTINDKINNIDSALRAFSMKLTGNKVDADDLFQDTALRIMANSDKYKDGTNFKAWAITIMRNIFINNYRKKVRRGVMLDQTDNNYFINSGTKVVRNEGESNATYKEMLQMVSSLPEEFKEPFWLAFKGFKYDEIAEKLDAPLKVEYFSQEKSFAICMK